MESLQNKMASFVYKIQNGRLDDGVPMGFIHITSSDKDGMICGEIIQKVHQELSELKTDPMPLIQVHSKTVRSDRIVEHVREAFAEAHRKCLRSVMVLITGFNAIDLECYADIASEYNLELYYDLQIAHNGMSDWIGNMADTYSIMNPIELSSVIHLRGVAASVLYILLTPYINMDESWTNIAGRIVE